MTGDLVRFPVERRQLPAAVYDQATEGEVLLGVAVEINTCSSPSHVFLADEEVCVCGAMWRVVTEPA